MYIQSQISNIDLKKFKRGDRYLSYNTDSSSFEYGKTYEDSKIKNERGYEVVFYDGASSEYRQRFEYIKETKFLVFRPSDFPEVKSENYIPADPAMMDYNNYRWMKISELKEGDYCLKQQVVNRNPSFTCDKVESVKSLGEKKDYVRPSIDRTFFLDKFLIKF